jgi:hypothetical protein
MPKYGNPKLTFEEKELEILKNAVDKIEKLQGTEIAQSPDMLRIIDILETFLKTKRLICYGGTAINNILPSYDQFYDKSFEIPDYDFYSPNALKDAKELSDIYYRLGYSDVEARSAVHVGTYKVFVNFIPVADITQMDTKLFRTLFKESIRKNGIYYAAPNFLRLNMYKELSRPKGDVSRWEKVYKRLLVFNKHYPMKNPKCDSIKFLRDFEGKSEDSPILYNVIKETMIDLGVVFVGGYASSLYSRYMPEEQRLFIQKVPDFDGLSDDPKTTATIIKERLNSAGFKNVKVYKKPGVWEIISPHYEVVVDNDTVCFIYEPLSCHSYNTIKIGNSIVKVATIDTMLNFFMAFLFADRPYYDKDRIICMAQYLFNVQYKNRLEQKGLLKRFSISCYGNVDESNIALRELKAEKFNELKHKRGSKEYEEYFLKYSPGDKDKFQENACKIKNKSNTRVQENVIWNVKKTNRKTNKRTKKNNKIFGFF